MPLAFSGGHRSSWFFTALLLAGVGWFYVTRVPKEVVLQFDLEGHHAFDVRHVRLTLTRDHNLWSVVDLETKNGVPSLFERPMHLQPGDYAVELLLSGADTRPAEVLRGTAHVPFFGGTEQVVLH